MKTFKNFKKFVNESILNEGQFSWMTQDTGNQIGSMRENTITVYMYDNKGNKWEEKKYDGYGEFGGKDFFDVVAEMNGYTPDEAKAGRGGYRQIGIDLTYGKIKTKNKDKKLLFPALVEDKNYNWKRHDFTKQAEDDPNQSWFQEEEDEYDFQGNHRWS